MPAKGIDIRETQNGDMQFRAFLQDSSGNLVTSGPTTLKLYEMQDDGALYSYDFNDNTFKSGALTTETVNMTHRQGNNNSTDTGIWTYDLSTVSDFQIGGIYFALVNNSNAFPFDQCREFQWGDGFGDLTVNTSGEASANVTGVNGNGSAATNLQAMYDGTGYAGGTTKLQVNTTQIEGSIATDQINVACDTALTDYDAVVPADLPTNFSDLSISASTGRVDVALIEGSDATDVLDNSLQGAGDDQVTISITSSGSPVADAQVWVTSDAAGSDVVAGPLTTDSDGEALFLLNDGNSYFLWMQKDGLNPITGEAFTASADS